MTVTAMTRSIAPLFGGSVYTWIVSYASKNIGPPFDISFVFFLFGLIYFIVCLVGVTIPNSLNEQKNIHTSHDDLSRKDFDPLTPGLQGTHVENYLMSTCHLLHRRYVIVDNLFGSIELALQLI
ncbi:hypothetical protein MAR_005378 [Mya arenaria]|uniref:Uncharacterized protein n=1 Tax=Mya arenaria TaxID=6604 RepID=A0ABY7EZB2_MYAAR|nr:hypothetical protein MAR_005378 [Mya arenaria]